MSDSTASLSTVELSAVPANEDQDRGATGKMPPMLAQYLDYKKQYPDALLLFQVGDFFELFFADAVTVSRVLNLTLTTRDKNNPDPIPMCGVPIGVVDGYVDRLVEAGFSVALVTQGALPVGKGMVPRKLERIVTPGVNILGSPKSAAGETRVAAIGGDPMRELALAFSNVQSGKIEFRDGIAADKIALELGLLGITEVVLPQVAYGNRLDRRSPWVRLVESALGPHALKFRSLSSADLSGAGSERPLTTVSGFSTLSVSAKQATRLLVDYIDEITVSAKIPLHSITPWNEAAIVAIDAPTRRNLELVANSRDGGTSGTLFEYLNECRAAAGSRLLHSWIQHPSSSSAEILRRHAAVTKLTRAAHIRATLRSRLLGMVDVERLAARLELSAASPRELGALRDAALRLPEMNALLLEMSPDADPDSKYCLLRAIGSKLELPAALASELERALTDNPPAVLSEANIFRTGYNSELDHLHGLDSEGRDWIAKLEDKERQASGISSLKVRFNNVLGYFIEITKANLPKVPERYIRRQSTANADRFTTPELAKLAEDVLGAKGKIIALERKLFEELRASMLQYTGQLRTTGEAVASIDILQSFAEIGVRDDLTPPLIDESNDLIIEKGRHPVLARLLREQFVFNSLELTGPAGRCAVITGPNMGGKSTYLRQAALIVVMAQLGCFVPAARARIGIVDKIFARIGASDNPNEGESTFMVEMREAAQIVSSSTGASLILIDEVGRGTATADGLAIAQAILEWLVVETKARTLFATHFHELTYLDSQYKALKNLSVGSIERDETVLFTHEIQKGPANRSYGLEVAKLAGLPASLLARAKALLSAINVPADAASRQLSIFAGAPEAAAPEPKNYRELQALADELRRIDVQSSTPLEALVALDRLTTAAAKIR